MIRIFALVFLAAVAAPPAGAQQPSAIPEALRKSCRADYQKFCATVLPGEGRVLACIRQNWSDVSPGCRAAIDAAAPARQ